MPFPERERFWMDLPFLLGQNNQGKHYHFFHFTLQRQRIHEKKLDTETQTGRKEHKVLILVCTQLTAKTKALFTETMTPIAM